jgi:membrane protein
MADQHRRGRAILSGLRQAVVRWSDHGAPTRSAAIAFYSITSMAPVSVLLVWVGAFVWEREAVRNQVVERLTTTLGPNSASLVEAALESASMPGGDALVPTALALAIFLFSATAVFGQVQGALREIWEVPASHERRVMGFLRRRLLALVLVSSLGLVLTISMAVRVVMSAVTELLPTAVPSRLYSVADVGISALFLILLFTLVFRILPDAQVRWGQATFGGVVTGLLFVLGQWVAGLYLGGAGIGSAYGAAGALIVFLFWVYYSSLVFLLGAEVTRTFSPEGGVFT